MKLSLIITALDIREDLLDPSASEGILAWSQKRKIERVSYQGQKEPGHLGEYMKLEIEHILPNTPTSDALAEFNSVLIHW